MCIGIWLLSYSCKRCGICDMAWFLSICGFHSKLLFHRGGSNLRYFAPCPLQDFTTPSGVLIQLCGLALNQTSDTSHSDSKTHSIFLYVSMDRFRKCRLHQGDTAMELSRDGNLSWGISKCETGESEPWKFATTGSTNINTWFNQADRLFPMKLVCNSGKAL